MKENDVKPRTIFVGLDLYYSQKFVDEILNLIADLQNQLQQKENIIKEVREYLDIDESIRKNCKRYDVNGIAILEILDKNFKLEETSKISKLCINNELQYNLKEEKKIPEK